MYILLVLYLLKSEEALVELLQSLADMDITFQALKVPLSIANQILMNRFMLIL